MNLFDIPAIDQHAHNLLQPESAALYPFPASFTEGYDPEIVNRHARHTLCYRRSLREIAALLDCEPQEEAILERRNSLGLEQLAQLYFKEANLEAIYLDDGLQPESILPLAWHQKFVPVQRILRLEVLAERLISEIDAFETFLEKFKSEIDPPPAEVVALKSIAAYRTGLDIQPVPGSVARSHFYALKQAQTQNASSQPLRLADKPLIDFLFQQATTSAGGHRPALLL